MMTASLLPRSSAAQQASQSTPKAKRATSKELPPNLAAMVYAVAARRHMQQAQNGQQSSSPDQATPPTPSPQPAQPGASTEATAPARVARRAPSVAARPRVLGLPPNPQRHTPLFRRNHARIARSPQGRCYDCHYGVSETTRDNCQSCHMLMQPRDHDLRFRTVGHGRVSAKDPSRCATCHEVDFCTECHNIAPTNHQPLSLFRGRHARAARANPRSCMTCHTFETTCERCHSIDTSVPPGNVLQGGLRR